MSQELLRPELHATAERGVLDAPAALLRDGQTWHLFYQYRLELPGPARWGHVTSEGSPCEWDVCLDVLAPEGDEETLRAGAVVAINPDVLHFYYTSVSPNHRDVHVARIAVADLGNAELDDDPLAVDTAVERLGSAMRSTAGLSDFRSPSVVPDPDPVSRADGWLMTAVTGDVERPAIAVARSRTGLDFHVEGILRFDGETGLAAGEALVSPRLLRLRDDVDQQIYHILLLTVEREEADLSGYLVGHLEGTTFRVVRPFSRLDYGHSFARPRAATLTPGPVPDNQALRSATLVGVMADAPGRRAARARGQDDHPTLATEGWAQCVSLPRTTTLQGGVLYQTPARGVVDAIANTSRARAWVGLCEVPDDGTSELRVEFVDGDGQVAAVVRHCGNKLVLDRSLCDFHRESEPTVAPLAEGDTDTLSVFVDGSAVEVYADGGSVTMTSRILFSGGCSGLRVRTEGAATILTSFSPGPDRISAPGQGVG